MNLIRSASVIARRDYIATVWSRTFLLFLVGPLFPILFGVLFSTVGAKMRPEATAPVIVVVANGEEGAALHRAQARLAGVVRLPELRIVPPEQADIAALRRDPGISAVLTGLPDRLVLQGSREVLAQYRPALAVLVDEMKRSPYHAPTIDEMPVVRPARDRDADRTALARGAQLLLVILTMILAGMLLSNMIEEKSSKVIEVLAAAVPVDAIFIGKLAAMLGMSLTGIFVWSLTLVGGLLLLVPAVFSHLPVPAVGWPTFISLGIAYFIASYLLVGALFLGIGAQAGTVREVQTLSMPATMIQLIFFWLASAALDDPRGPLGIAAVVVPWSSPFAMLGHAAREPALWPHLIAFAWQTFSIGSIILFGSRLFRRSVLKSGGGLFRRRRA